RPVRSRAHRRRVGVRPVPLRDATDADADPDDRWHPDRRRLLPALRRAVRDDAGRSAAKHGQRAVLHVRGRFQVVESGQRVRGCLSPVPAHLRGDARPDARGAPGAGLAMTGVAMAARSSRPALMPRPAAIVVNGLLAGLAVVALFPLLWMLSVSFMAPGASSVYPPQLLPHEPTLANYREPFPRVGVGRYLANSLLVAVAATALSLFFNVTAGYAFAKLRFAGRDRIFRLMLGALVIPGQVAMVPLFLLLKQLGLVNSYGG